MALILTPPTGWNLSRSADHAGHATAVRSWSEAAKEIHRGRAVPHIFFQSQRSLVSGQHKKTLRLWWLHNYLAQGFE